MLRCSSCKQARWVHVRFRTHADSIEWLTGWVPYRCDACARRGWHHAHRVPPAANVIRQLAARIAASVGAVDWKGAAQAVRERLRSGLTRILEAAQATRGRLRAGVTPIAGAALATRERLRARLTPLAGTMSRATTKTTVRIRIASPRFAMPFKAHGARLTRPFYAMAGGLFAVMGVGVWVGPQLFSTSAPEAAIEVTTEAAQKLAPVEAPGSAPVPVEPVSPAPVDADLPEAPSAVVDAAVPKAAAKAGGAPEPAVAQNLAPPSRERATRARPDRRPPAPARTASRSSTVAQSKPAPSAVAKAPDEPKFHGTLSIRSEPVGALVWVDGELAGATPLVLKNIPVGSRVVRIESNGYERWSSAARVVANQQTSIIASLQRGSGQ